MSYDTCEKQTLIRRHCTIYFVLNSTKLKHIRLVYMVLINGVTQYFKNHKYFKNNFFLK